MNILFIGDIVGNPGREAVKILLPKIKKEEAIKFTIANAENAAGGAGLTPNIASELLEMDIDVLTTGDHIWDRKEILEVIDKEHRILRPLNYPEGTPGIGSIILSSKSGAKVGVINLVGRVFMQAVECPFKTGIKEVNKIKEQTPIVIVDIHAEATSEKLALCWYLDGLVTAICGTHTHIQTADERIFPKGTAYVTDLGMTGPFDSVLGRRPEQIIRRFITGLPTRFEMADSNVQLQGVIIDCDEKTGKANSIKRIQKKIA
ncbi:MAG: metallophosphoesterase [Omnitrophica WOR_2 bacterium SM23_29]|nr:MAG: metallophosphoesterase [Omnitrophica WOR_2 bacterium SM23_29]